MKILWVTNVPIGAICDQAGIPHPTSGGWMESLLAEMEEAGDVEISVLSTWKGSSSIRLTQGTTTYHLLSCGHAATFNYRSSRNLAEIHSVIDAEKPDLVHFWGTEYPLGFAVSECLDGLPSVIFVQGLLAEIARYYQAGMSTGELRRAVSLRDVLKLDWIARQKRKYERSSRLESTLIRRSGHVISENGWVNAHCRAVRPDVVIHHCELSIRAEFNECRWLGPHQSPTSIMCNASGYPIKGLHILLKALPAVLHRHPDTQLIVPGRDLMPGSRLVDLARRTGYSRYIEYLIGSLGLRGHVRFVGTLDPGAMAQWMSESRAFVVPSAIENQSSSLKEAMTVGVPCVASYVGGIPEYLVHRQNGLLYRFEDHEMLAQCICEILDNQDLAESLSRGALRTMAVERESGSVAEKMVGVYHEVVGAEGPVRCDSR